MMKRILILGSLLTIVLFCSMCRARAETAESTAERLVAFTDEYDLYLIDSARVNAEPELISNDTRGTAWSVDGKTLYYLQLTSSDIRGMSYELDTKTKIKLFNIAISRNSIATETYWGVPGVKLDMVGNKGIRVDIQTETPDNEGMTQGNRFAYDFASKKLYGETAPPSILAWRDEYPPEKYVDYLENRLVKGKNELFNVQSKRDPNTGVNSQVEIQLSHVSRFNFNFENGPYEEINYDVSPKSDKVVYMVGNSMGEFFEGYNVLVNMDGTKETYVGKSGSSGDKFYWMSNGNLITCEFADPEKRQASLAVYDSNNDKSIFYKSTGAVNDINPRP